MVKISLSKPTSGFNLAAINENFSKIEQEFQTKVLYRNNPVGEPNALETPIDANGKRIYNVPNPISNSDVVPYGFISDEIADVRSIAIEVEADRVDAEQSALEAMNAANAATNMSLKYQVSSVEPTVRVDNTPLQVGDQWVDSNTGLIYQYSGSIYYIPSIESSILASPSGSNTVGFLQSGTGAVVRTLQSKNRDLVSLKDFAIGDGVADDSTALTNALAATDTLQGAKNSRFLTGQFNVATDKKIGRIRIYGKTGIAALMNMSAGASNTVLSEADIEAQAGIVWNQNAANGLNNSILGASLKSPGYGVLSNSGSAGCDGLIISHSYIESSAADAIEFNHTNSGAANYLVNGAILKAGPTAGTGTSGFAVGIAGTQGYVISNLIVRYARNSAIHIEDPQRRGVVANVSAYDCKSSGFTVQKSNIGGDEDGVLTSNFHMQHTGTKTGYYGWWNINNAFGSVELNAANNHYMRDFDAGYFSDGTGTTAFGSVISEDCNISVKIGNNTALGNFYSKNTPVLAESNGRGVIGKVISTTPATTILNRIGTTYPGPYLKGIVVPFAVAHPGGSVLANFPIFALPSRMAGKATIVFGRSGGIGGFYSADVLWDGTTLTLANVIQQANGPTGITLVADTGNLALRFSTAAAFTADLARIDFDGVYYQN